MLVLVAVACAGHRAKAIGPADFGTRWPFTVKSGTLRCEAGRLVTLEARGKTYAINERAQRRAAARGWRDVGEIWATGPPVVGYLGKKNIGPIQAEGAKLCDSGKGSVVVSGVPGRILSAAAAARWAKQQRRYLATLNNVQLNAYTKANIECGLTAFTGRTPDPQKAGEAAEAHVPGTGAAARRGCSDSVAGPPPGFH